MYQYVPVVVLSDNGKVLVHISDILQIAALFIQVLN
jgi:hypothetical protein